MCPCWFDTVKNILTDPAVFTLRSGQDIFFGLINCVDRSLLDDRIAHQSGRLQILMVHVDRGDLAVVVGGVVVDALVCVAAGGVEGDLILAVFEEAAASLLFHGSEDVEKLADAFLLRVPGAGVHFRESGPDETGLGREIARKSDGSHTAAVSLER